MTLNPEFSERYHSARSRMARTLLDSLLDEAKTVEPERALLLKTKAGIIQWAISRFNPKEFSDSKRIELQGQINHVHTHQLPDEQKRRIAEAWLMSKQMDDSPGIVSETTGPDLVGVSTVDEPTRELPKRKKAALPKAKASDDGDNWRRD